MENNPDGHLLIDLGFKIKNQHPQDTMYANF